MELNTSFQLNCRNQKIFGKCQFEQLFPACVYMYVCMCKFTSFYLKGFFCLEHLRCQEIDQGCCAQMGYLLSSPFITVSERITELFRLAVLPRSLDSSNEGHNCNSVRLTFKLQGSIPSTVVVLGPCYIVSRSASGVRHTRGGPY